MATYARVEATGTVEQLNPQGVKIDGLWWNPSKRIAIDLTRFRTGDVVFMEGDETADGARRWIAAIDFADGHQRQAPAPAPAAATVYEPDPDDLPDSPGRPAAPQSDKADRMACLQVAAGVLMPWWVKKGADTDGAVLIGLADQLLAYVQHRA